MEVVNRLPKPENPEALAQLVDAQRILCARCVSEEDGQQALQLLAQLAEPVEGGGYGYFPALLTLASLYSSGFEPAVEKDLRRAAGCYLRALSHEQATSVLPPDLLSEAATELCNIVKEGSLTFTVEERCRLDSLARGEGAGSVPDVSAWARFVCVEVDRIDQANREDPGARQRRLAREAARQAAREEEQARQKESALAALAHAEELRSQGNDACRQGQLPGNASASQDLLRASALYSDATAALSACLGAGLEAAPEEAAELRRQRCLLLSNAAQVQVTLKDWPEVIRLAMLALEDDPYHAKSSLRLARAHMELHTWKEAAAAVDGALARLAAGPGAGDDAARIELWKAAKEVSKSLPDWKWSCSRPKAAEPKKQQDDYEKRIVGFWEYGQPGQSACFQIRLEPWGALVFHEETVKIDLMRKGLLRWRGELELISGMVLNLAYEPGSDVITTEFIPPPDVPEEQQWKGPKKFTARRSAKAPPEAEASASKEEAAVAETDRRSAKASPEAEASASKEEAAVPEADRPPPIAAFSSPSESPVTPPQAETRTSEQDKVAAAQQGAPKELWLVGCPELRGCYQLLADRIANDRPVFSRGACDRQVEEGELFLWSRGGNWGVTASLHPSSLAVPFLARCPDPSGRARHPLELRRPRWHVRTGRGQEEFDAGVQLTAEPPAEVADTVEGTSKSVARAAAGSAPEVASEPPPPTVEISGRESDHAEVNGVYRLTRSMWEGRPVYRQDEQERPLALFYENGYWTVAAEVCSLPRALARCPAAATNGTAEPAAAGRSPSSTVTSRAWEFLCGERFTGAMVTTETRTYKVDRQVVLSVPGVRAEVPQEAAAIVRAAPVAQERAEIPAALEAAQANADPPGPALDDMD